MEVRTEDIPKYARFGGREYRLKETHRLKKDAVEAARRERQKGNWTRITEGANGWQLWVKV